MSLGGGSGTEFAETGFYLTPNLAASIGERIGDSRNIPKGKYHVAIEREMERELLGVLSREEIPQVVLAKDFLENKILLQPVYQAPKSKLIESKEIENGIA